MLLAIRSSRPQYGAFWHDSYSCCCVLTNSLCRHPNGRIGSRNGLEGAIRAGTGPIPPCRPLNPEVNMHRPPFGTYRVCKYTTYGSTHPCQCLLRPRQTSATLRSQPNEGLPLIALLVYLQKAPDSRETPSRPVLHLPRLYPGHLVLPCISISGCSSIVVGPPSEEILGVVSNISPFTSRYIPLVLGMLAARLWHCYHQHHLNGWRYVPLSFCLSV